MGLSFSYCPTGTSYSGFQHLRVRLAQEAGIDPSSVNTGAPAVKKQEQDGGDPLCLFLQASDSIAERGAIHPQKCEPIAERIRELVKEWSDASGGFMGTKGYALEIANGLETAARKNDCFRII